VSQSTNSLLFGVQGRGIDYYFTRRIIRFCLAQKEEYVFFVIVFFVLVIVTEYCLSQAFIGKNMSSQSDLDSKLREAIEKNDNNTVMATLGDGANSNAVVGDSSDEYGSENVLMFAIRHGNCDAIEMLVQRGALVHGLDSKGLNALHYAAENRRAVALKLLLSLGADVDSRTRYGWTALMCGVQKNDVDTVTSLVEGGADVKAFSGGYTAWMLAREHARTRNGIVVVALIAKAIRRQDAHVLLNWQIAMAPLELPICEFTIVIMSPSVLLLTARRHLPLPC
jgi:ankyrin repeat protein